MTGDREWDEARRIIAGCADAAELDAAVIRHAKVMLYLICHKAHGSGLPEESIRWLYAEFAEMAVQEFFRRDRKPFFD